MSKRTLTKAQIHMRQRVADLISERAAEAEAGPGRDALEKLAKEIRHIQPVALDFDEVKK